MFCLQISQRKWGKALLSCLLAIALSWSLSGCRDRIQSTPEPSGIPPVARPGETISEVAPPAVLQELGQLLENYQPQVTIVSPAADAVIDDTTVRVQVQVQDLPTFKDPELGMGPHLHVILDNQPYRAVYDVDQPIVFTDLPPGTHTLRIFAARPWHESFKNEGAYAQTTFHLFTKTGENAPDPNRPLLTYSRPKGNYGAEPILLDFYLTNAPLRLIAQEESETPIADWRIRATVNGQSFLLDSWLPIYLEGFKRGRNWVQLELLDTEGNPIDNAFNNTARLITYEPNGQDTLSKLVRGELSAVQARSIVDPSYRISPEEVLEPEVPAAPEEVAPSIEPEAPAEPEVIPPSPEEIMPKAQEPEAIPESESPAPAAEETTTAPTTSEETVPQQSVQPPSSQLEDQPSTEQQGEERLPLPGEAPTLGEPSQEKPSQSKSSQEKERLMPEKPETLPEIVEGQPVPKPDRPSKTKKAPPTTKLEEKPEGNEQ